MTLWPTSLAEPAEIASHRGPQLIYRPNVLGRKTTEIKRLNGLVESAKDAHRAHAETLRRIAGELDQPRAVTKSAAGRQLRALAAQLDALADAQVAAAAATTWPTLAKAAAISILLAPAISGAVEGIAGAVSEDLLKNQARESSAVVALSIEIEQCASDVSALESLDEQDAELNAPEQLSELVVESVDRLLQLAPGVDHAIAPWQRSTYADDEALAAAAEAVYNDVHRRVARHQVTSTDAVNQLSLVRDLLLRLTPDRPHLLPD